MSRRWPRGFRRVRWLRTPRRCLADRYRCRCPAAAYRTEGQTMFSPHFLNTTPSVAIGLLTALALSASAASAQGQAKDMDKASIVARGEYLAQAGDCVACHTAPGGKLFAGGHAMPTPFGTLYTSNVTPDRDTGIGKWTADQFYSMMHTGRSSDGGLLYPAMPFASYTKVTRADSDAIFAFMQS